jgi:uncharacterized membrane protein
MKLALMSGGLVLTRKLSQNVMPAGRYTSRVVAQESLPILHGRKLIAPTGSSDLHDEDAERRRMHYPEIIETLGAAIDIAGVVLIIVGLLVAAARYLLIFRTADNGYTRFRQDIGRAILLGLEVLVAADIIRTVAVTPTLVSVAVLAGIVIIRTFLSFSLEVELNGRFPWQERTVAARTAPSRPRQDG